MGRGRGKGKKLTVVTGLDDPGSGEETLPAYKRRGRPQKPLKEDLDDEEVEKLEKADIEVAKLASLNKENGKPTAVENGKKRKRNSQVKENPTSVKEEKGVTTDNIKTNGFRHNGSRRKSKPRRAAEAGVNCKYMESEYSQYDDLSRCDEFSEDVLLISTPTNRRKAKRKSTSAEETTPHWNQTEDQHLCITWLRITVDPVRGTNQSLS